MAGRPQKRANDILQAENQLLRERLEAKRKQSTQPATLNDQTREQLINDMFDRADEGQTLDEIAAAWNLDGKEQLVKWGEEDVEFGSALRRARTRALASISRTLRLAMQSGRSVPGSFVDRVNDLYTVGALGGEHDASRLVRVNMRPPDNSELTTRDD